MSKRKLKCGCVSKYNTNSKNVKLGLELSSVETIEYCKKHEPKKDKTPTEKLTYSAEVQCRLANERFGLQQGLRFVLGANFNCNDVAVEYIIKLASDCKLHELKEFMGHVGTNESDKPRHTRIRNPSSVNGLY